jgi:uncharacterized protein YecT (DUF1311 family)
MKRKTPARLLATAGVLLLASAVPAQDGKKEDIPDPQCDGSTYDIVKCLADATAKWDKRLNAAYQGALKDIPANQREQLRTAQRLWLQYRDANCLYYGLGEGTIARINAGSCMFDMTKARVKELEEGMGN